MFNLQAVISLDPSEFDRGIDQAQKKFKDFSSNIEGISKGVSNAYSRMKDVLAAAATNANTNVSMLGESFKYAAPIAGAMGYSVEDASIALGLMANSGIKASSAGTALRSIMTRLATNAGATKTQMGALEILTEKLGVEFYNTDGTARDLNSVLEEAREAWKGLGDEQSVSYAKTIAG